MFRYGVRAPKIGENHFNLSGQDPVYHYCAALANESVRRKDTHLKT